MHVQAVQIGTCTWVCGGYNHSRRCAKCTRCGPDRRGLSEGRWLSWASGNAHCQQPARKATHHDPACRGCIVHQVSDVLSSGICSGWEAQGDGGRAVARRADWAVTQPLHVVALQRYQQSSTAEVAGGCTCSRMSALPSVLLVLRLPHHRGSMCIRSAESGKQVLVLLAGTLVVMATAVLQWFTWRRRREGEPLRPTSL